MLRTVLISSIIVLLACQGRYNRQRNYQDNQIDNIVRFISDVQLYQINRENSRSRSLLFLPCSLDRVRGLKGVCRNLNKQKLPNTLYRLNQFLAKRKKYQNKLKIKEAEKIQKKKEEENDGHISENIIQDSQGLNDIKKIQLNQENNISVETSTKVVFLNLSENAIHNETATELEQIVEAEEENGEVAHEIHEETTTVIEQVLKGNGVDEHNRYVTNETHDETTTEFEQVLQENVVDEGINDLIHKKIEETTRDFGQVLQDDRADEESEASGDEVLFSETVTELIDESIDTVTDLPDEDSSIRADLLDNENIIENSIEFEKIMKAEELIISLTERIEDDESSGEREDFEVNFP